MMDIVTKLKVLRNELQAFKASDSAKPHILSNITGGEYILHKNFNINYVNVKVTSTGTDFPFLNVGTYSVEGDEIQQQFIVQRDPISQLSSVNTFYMNVGHVGIDFRLKWSVMGQSVATVEFSEV